ncbi:MAG: hypothetical protein WCP12_04540 [bacterium]
MKSVLVAFLTLWGFITVFAATEDQHLLKTNALKEELRTKTTAILNSADEIDLGLQQYNYKSKATDQARLVVTNMFKASAWKDLQSRETKKNKEALVALNKLLDKARLHITTGQQELSTFKEAEYQAWAKAHPTEAKELEMKERLESAEAAAHNAQMQAQEAQAAANRARQDAETARIEAQEAQQSSLRAQRQMQEAVRKAKRSEYP